MRQVDVRAGLAVGSPHLARRAHPIAARLISRAERLIGEAVVNFGIRVLPGSQAFFLKKASMACQGTEHAFRLDDGISLVRFPTAEPPLLRHAESMSLIDAHFAACKLVAC